METLEIFILALVTIYIVDLSGFTNSWKHGLAKWLKVSVDRLRTLKPFDCGQCMTWWVCNIYAVCIGAWNLYTMAFIALLAFLSVPIGSILIFMREGLNSLSNKLMDLL